jgi:hypothetical protein
LDGDTFFANTGCVTKNVFFVGLIIAASGQVSPPIALAAGLIYGFSFVHPFHVEAKKLSKLLLQASVVGLGFGMDLQQVMQAGRSGFIYTAGSISIDLLLGWGLGRLLAVKQRISYLISAGTAKSGPSERLNRMRPNALLTNGHFARGACLTCGGDVNVLHNGGNIKRACRYNGWYRN